MATNISLFNKLNFDVNFFTSKDAFFKKAAYVFFIGYFLIGCFAYSDYGISTDEEVQRFVIGGANYIFIETGNEKELLANDGKYHGPAFELLLYGAEKVLNITEEKSCYLLRHFITFLCFYISLICFYLLSLKVFKCHFAALLSVLILSVSPRIFAESFYNSKDLAMLCFCIISTYTMFLFVEKQSILTALLHAVCCGFAFDIRVMAILIPVATFYLLLFQKKKNVLPIILYVFYLVLSVIVFWPVLWLGPVYHIGEAFKQMSNYPGNGTVLYMGKFVPTQNIPWHYLPVWIGITTPVYYIVLFITGLIFLLRNTLNNFKSTAPFHVFLFVFVVPIAAVIILHSTVYDSWRHIYFVYPFFVLIVVYGFIQVIYTLKNKLIRTVFVGASLISLVSVCLIMFKHHPHQNVYFNVLAGNNIRENYDMDYWGLSYKQGLDFILKNDSSAHINVICDYTDIDLTCWLNFGSFPDSEKKRLFFTYDFNEANYFLTNFKLHPNDYTFGTSFYKIELGDTKIMEVIKLK